MKPKIDPITLEVFRNLFSSVAEEMGESLVRTAFSANIKERRDLSAAVFDSDGEMIAQAAHIPVHLGAMPASVRAAIDQGAMAPGDIVMLNDPSCGGSHLPDVTFVAPVFVSDGQEPDFYVANRAHHADVGGSMFGSMLVATDIYQEGIRIPPVHIVRAGEVQRDVLALFIANVRTPRERQGDIEAQTASIRTGIRRLEQIVARHGVETAKRYAGALQDYSEKVTRAALSEIPDGVYEFEDFLDNDGISERAIRIRATVKVDGSDIEVDFSGTDSQVAGSVNANLAVTMSAVYYVIRCLVRLDIPFNAGCMRPVTIVAEEGSLVNARHPAAVSAGNVETSQRIVDVVLGALSKAIPETIPAAGCGTMNNVTLGGTDPRTGDYFAYYETIGGGMGASARMDGQSAVHTHMTNTMNTPVEALERAFPLRVRRYSVRRGSGGGGRHSGGDGIVREIESLCVGSASIISERRKFAPYGLHGGEPGERGRNTLMREGETEALPSKCNIAIRPGDVLRIETPGGGGFGRAEED
ncbi:MAG TPA: hydantoinase B/oxoprolinase family protein [bacterium]|nr:hydantoinase B/oxoprolinase family protein [bacterium]